MRTVPASGNELARFKILSFRVTEEEMKTIEEKAKEKGISKSELCRKEVLASPTKNLKTSPAFA